MYCLSKKTAGKLKARFLYPFLKIPAKTIIIVVCTAAISEKPKKVAPETAATIRLLIPSIFRCRSSGSSLLNTNPMVENMTPSSMSVSTSRRKEESCRD
jgi:hypothetical protein